MIFSSILILISGFILGNFYTRWSNSISEKRDLIKKTLEVNNQYKQVLEKVKTKRSRFKTRINNTVFIGVNLQDYGKVDLLYFLEKRDISIFKGDKCIMTSNDVSKELLTEIVDNIDRVHYNKIVDVVEVLGFVFYRKDFEKNFNINLKEIKEKADNIMKLMKESESDIEKIINENQKKLDIDDILDKINKVGIENLTKEELEFLNNFNK